MRHWWILITNIWQDKKIISKFSYIYSYKVPVFFLSSTNATNYTRCINWPYTVSELKKNNRKNAFYLRIIKGLHFNLKPSAITFFSFKVGDEIELCLAILVLYHPWNDPFRQWNRLCFQLAISFFWQVFYHELLCLWYCTIWQFISFMTLTFMIWQFVNSMAFYFKSLRRTIFIGFTILFYWPQIYFITVDIAMKIGYTESLEKSLYYIQFACEGFYFKHLLFAKQNLEIYYFYVFFIFPIEIFLMYNHCLRLLLLGLGHSQIICITRRWSVTKIN